METTARAEIILDFVTTTVQSAGSDLDLTNEEVARAVGVDRKTVARWLKGQSEPSPENREHLERLNEIRFLMESSFRSREARQRWLHAPLDALRGRTPYAALRDGKLEQVFRLLASLEAGAFR